MISKDMEDTRRSTVKFTTPMFASRWSGISRSAASITSRILGEFPYQVGREYRPNDDQGGGSRSMAICRVSIPGRAGGFRFRAAQSGLVRIAPPCSDLPLCGIPHQYSEASRVNSLAATPRNVRFVCIAIWPILSFFHRHPSVGLQFACLAAHGL
jgi:hypothetical protein